MSAVPQSVFSDSGYAANVDAAYEAQGVDPYTTLAQSALALGATESPNTGPQVSKFADLYQNNDTVLAAKGVGGMGAQKNLQTPSNIDPVNNWANVAFQQEYGLSPTIANEAEVTQYLQSLTPQQEDADIEAGDKIWEADASPQTGFDKLAQFLALTGTVGVATAGVGGVLGSPAGLGLDATSAGTVFTDVAAGAVGGALKGGFTDTSVGKGALLGAASGLVQGVVKTSGLQQGITDTTGSNVVGSVATKAAGSLATGELDTAITGKQGSTLTSSTGQSAVTTGTGTGTGSSASQLSGDSGTSGGGGSSTSTLSAGVMPINSAGASVSAVPSDLGLGGGSSLGTIAAPTNTAPALQGAPSSGSSFLGDVGTGLASTLGGGSLGTDLGTLLPYAGVAAIGEAQAAAGQAQDAKASQQQQALGQPAINESNQLLGSYNSGTLNATDQAVVNTGIAQGQDTIASASGLSAIAQTAFANYNSGQLDAADQTQLNNQVAAQKQQVAQNLASAGITDSTILAGQNQQIDNQALITKNSLLNSYFNTGNTAYNSWLTATNEGKAAITAAQTYASNSLNTYLTNSMQEANIGIGEVNTAIQTQMNNDQLYAAQVSTLMGTLATAYAKQIAGQNANGGGTSLLSSTGRSAASGAAGSAAAAAGSSAGNFLNTKDPNSATGQTYNQEEDQQLTTETDNQLNSDTAGLGDQINSELDSQLGTEQINWNDSLLDNSDYESFDFGD